MPEPNRPHSHIDAFIRSHASCPGLDMKDSTPDDLTEDAAQIRVKLFCTTCQRELHIHVPIADFLTREQIERRGAASVMLERVREIMQLDQPN
ncbi:MAG: hypothetical protein ACE5JN_08270 [Candidatus Methylomirabilia bacterium]